MRPSISDDGPHAITDVRRWLARQLLDSKLSDDEAFGVVAFHPAIKPESTNEIAEGGWMAVPREPTGAMCVAGHEAIERRLGYMKRAPFARDAYRAMIAAVPTLPTREWTDEEVEAAARAYDEECGNRRLWTDHDNHPAGWASWRRARGNAMRAALATLPPTAEGWEGRG